MDEERKYKSVKLEISKLDEKIKLEKARLNKIHPNRQILSGADIDYLSEKDIIKYAELNDFVSRYENKKRGSPEERIKIKKELRKLGIEFDKNASLEQLKSFYSLAVKGIKQPEISKENIKLDC